MSLIIVDSHDRGYTPARKTIELIQNIEVQVPKDPASGAALALNFKERLPSAMQSCLGIAAFPQLKEGHGNDNTEYGKNKPEYIINLEKPVHLPLEFGASLERSDAFFEAIHGLDDNVSDAFGATPSTFTIHQILRDNSISFKTPVFRKGKGPKDPMVDAGAMYMVSDPAKTTASGLTVETFYGVPCYRMEKTENGWEEIPIRPSEVEAGDIISVIFGLSPGKTPQMAFVSRYLKGVQVWAKGSAGVSGQKRVCPFGEEP